MASVKKTTSPKAGKTKQSEPQTMEELLAQTGAEIKGLRRGDVVEGVITEIKPRSVLIDIGGKTEGLVTDQEFLAAREYIKTLREGDKVEAYVVSPENESGQIILSLRGAANEFNWNKIKEWHEADEILRVKVLEVNRGGAIVNVIDDVTGFVPASQFRQELQDQLEDLDATDLEVKILDFDRQEGKLILSEKSVSEAEDIERKRQLIAMLEEGKVYQGVVSRVVPFGVFVKINLKNAQTKKKGIEDTELEGLVHISELSWEKVNNPADIAGVGDKVKVKVISADAKLGKLSLSLKQLTPDPWENIEEKYPVDKQVKGKIVRVAPFGVFVELEKGIEGLIHVSKLNPEQEYRPGEEITCFIESVDVKGRRISLSLPVVSAPIYK